MSALLLPNDILSLSAQAAKQLISAGNGDGALLYLALLDCGGDGARARKALKWDSRRLEDAYALLVRLELAVPSQALQPSEALPEPDRPPEYSRSDVAAALEREDAFSGLYRAVEKCLGAPMNDTDLKSLYTIYDYLALPAEVILMLAHRCAAEAERKLGPGRRPRMTEIKKAAFRWKRMGLDTVEAAEDFLRRQQTLAGRERDILPLLDIRDRPPVDREREYIAAWVDMGFSDDAIRLAYERTLFQKQKLNWPYMNSILKRWHQAGLHTAAQVEAGDKPPAKQASPHKTGQVPGSFQPSAERIQKNADWLDQFLENQGKGG